MNIESKLSSIQTQLSELLLRIEALEKQSKEDEHKEKPECESNFDEYCIYKRNIGCGKMDIFGTIIFKKIYIQYQISTWWTYSEIHNPDKMPLDENLYHEIYDNLGLENFTEKLMLELNDKWDTSEEPEEPIEPKEAIHKTCVQKTQW